MCFVIFSRNIMLCFSQSENNGSTSTYICMYYIYVIYFYNWLTIVKYVFQGKDSNTLLFKNKYCTRDIVSTVEVMCLLLEQWTNRRHERLSRLTLMLSENVCFGKYLCKTDDRVPPLWSLWQKTWRMLKEYPAWVESLRDLVATMFCCGKIHGREW